MPTLFKRSNGIYYITYNHDGKRRWKSTGKSDHSLALKSLLKFDRDPHPPSTKTCLSHFAEELLSSARAEFTSGTVLIYQQSFKRFTTLIGDLPMAEISSRHVDLFKTRRSSEVSGVTLNIELRTLRAAFNKAVRWNIIAGNPFRGVPLMRIAETQPTFFSKEEFNELLAVIEESWFRDLITLAVCSGLRRGELLNLRWEDVDLERRMMLIQSSGALRTKFGRRRTLPLSATAVETLRRRALGEMHGFIFHDSGRRLLDSTITHKFKRYIRTAKLNPRLHFHSLRHTFATWLVQNSVSLYEVQKLLGHSSIKITEVYAHLAPNALHGCVEKIRL